MVFCTKSLAPVSAALALAAPAWGMPLPFTPGNLLIVHVAAEQDSAGPMEIREITPEGRSVQTLPIPSGAGGLRVPSTHLTSGDLQPNRTPGSWTVAGYIPPFSGTGSLSARTSTEAPRGFLTLYSNGTTSAAATALPDSGGTSGFNKANIRSGVAHGSKAWLSGSSGVVFYNGTTATATPVLGINARNLKIHNGDLYFTTATGLDGVYKFSGLPEALASSTIFLAGVKGQFNNPTDFEISPDSMAAYLTTGIGVQKFTRPDTSSPWVLSANFTHGTSQDAWFLAVDWSKTQPVLFWSTPEAVYSAVDAGGGVAGSPIASIPAGGGAFRGIDLVPRTEPSLEASPSNLPAFSTILGYASSALPFFAGGSGIHSSITIAAPPFFEISTSETGPFLPQLELPPADGTLPATAVYTRLSALAPAGIFSGNITLSFHGALSRQVAVSGTIPTPYSGWTAHWQNRNQSFSGNAALAGSDPDGDGYANQMEFAFGGDPLSPSGPKLSVTSDALAATFTFLARTANNAVWTAGGTSGHGVDYQIQSTQDPAAGFRNAVIAVSPSQNQDGIASGDFPCSRWEFTAPLSTGKNFFRIQATLHGGN